MTLLAVFLVYAADLPARQPPPAPVEGECVAEAPVRIGERPAFVATDGRATCRGVLVGTSTYTDLLASQDDAEMVRALYRVDEATWQDDRASAALREAYWREIAARTGGGAVISSAHGEGSTRRRGYTLVHPSRSPHASSSCPRLGRGQHLRHGQGRWPAALCPHHARARACNERARRLRHPVRSRDD